MLRGSQFSMLSSPAKESMCFQLLASCQVGMRYVEAAPCFAFNDLQNKVHVMKVLPQKNATAALRCICVQWLSLSHVGKH